MLDALGVLVARPMSAIKSVQYGTVSVGSSATITAVTIGKSVLIYLGGIWTDPGGGASTTVGVYITLTNSTTVTATGGAGVATASFVVVEFW